MQSIGSKSILASRLGPQHRILQGSQGKCLAIKIHYFFYLFVLFSLFSECSNNIYQLLEEIQTKKIDEFCVEKRMIKKDEWRKKIV